MAAGLARAQDALPGKTITMIVPFPPGGSTDVIARIVAEGLRQSLGQPVVIDNRAGASGMLGTGAIVRAAPDGSTIGMGTASTLAINQAVIKSQPYDVTTDLTAIGNIADVPNIMSLNPGVPAQNMAEFIALAKSQPGSSPTRRQATGRSVTSSASNSSSRPAPICCMCRIAAWARR